MLVALRGFGSVQNASHLAGVWICRSRDVGCEACSTLFRTTPSIENVRKMLRYLHGRTYLGSETTHAMKKKVSLFGGLYYVRWVVITVGTVSMFGGS